MRVLCVEPPHYFYFLVTSLLNRLRETQFLAHIAAPSAAPVRIIMLSRVICTRHLRKGYRAANLFGPENDATHARAPV